jgi:hypothetical protein
MKLSYRGAKASIQFGFEGSRKPSSPGLARQSIKLTSPMKAQCWDQSSPDFRRHASMLQAPPPAAAR